MRIKIRDTWYDSDKEPLCVQVSDTEQQQIAEMDRTIAVQGKYAVFPPESEMSVEDKEEWMLG